MHKKGYSMGQERYNKRIESGSRNQGRNGRRCDVGAGIPSVRGGNAARTAVVSSTQGSWRSKHALYRHEGRLYEGGRADPPQWRIKAL